MTVAELKDLLNEFDEEANVSAYLQGALYSFSIRSHIRDVYERKLGGRRRKMSSDVYVFLEEQTNGNKK